MPELAQAEQAQAAAGADSGQVWRAAARSLSLSGTQQQVRPLFHTVVRGTNLRRPHSSHLMTGAFAALDAARVFIYPTFVSKCFDLL